MRSTTKEVVKMTIVLVVLFLVLTHFTGFSRDVGAATTGWRRIITAFQGR